MQISDVTYGKAKRYVTQAPWRPRTIRTVTTVGTLSEQREQRWRRTQIWCICRAETFFLVLSRQSVCFLLISLVKERLDQMLKTEYDTLEAGSCRQLEMLESANICKPSWGRHGHDFHGS